MGMWNIWSVLPTFFYGSFFFFFHYNCLSCNVVGDISNRCALILSLNTMKLLDHCTLNSNFWAFFQICHIWDFHRFWLLHFKIHTPLSLHINMDFALHLSCMLCRHNFSIYLPNAKWAGVHMDLIFCSFSPFDTCWNSPGVSWNGPFGWHSTKYNTGIDWAQKYGFKRASKQSCRRVMLKLGRVRCKANSFLWLYQFLRCCHYQQTCALDILMWNYIKYTWQRQQQMYALCRFVCMQAWTDQ